MYPPGGNPGQTAELHTKSGSLQSRKNMWMEGAGSTQRKAAGNSWKERLTNDVR